NLGVEVARHSLESIQPLCAHLFKCKMCDSVYAEAPKQLFRTFFQSIFDNSIELEVFDLSSNVLYSFICCFPYLFTDLVSQLIRTKFATSTELKQKIESGFKNLITSPNQSNLEVNLSMFNLEKRNRIKFNSRFNEFCIKTYGLLFIR
ncbi:exportin-4, partial [Brachionus plicatilis]